MIPALSRASGYVWSVIVRKDQGTHRPPCTDVAVRTNTLTRSSVHDTHSATFVSALPADDVLSKWSVEIAAALTSIEAVLHRVAGAQIGSRAAVEVFKRAAGQLLAVPIVLAPPVKQPIHARHGAVVRLDPQAWHARGGPCGMQPVAQRQQGVAEVPAPLPL